MKTPKPSVTDKPSIYHIYTYFVVVFIFLLICLMYAYVITEYNTPETKVIQIKYFSDSNAAITDNCGHPIQYDYTLKPNLNISDVYEITLLRNDIGYEKITSFKLIDKEKYIDNC